MVGIADDRARVFDVPARMSAACASGDESRWPELNPPDHRGRADNALDYHPIEDFLTLLKTSKSRSTPRSC
jgi:hypothetical protein